MARTVSKRAFEKKPWASLQESWTQSRRPASVFISKQHRESYPLLFQRKKKATPSKAAEQADSKTQASKCDACGHHVDDHVIANGARCAVTSCGCAGYASSQRIVACQQCGHYNTAHANGRCLKCSCPSMMTPSQHASSGQLYPPQPWNPTVQKSIVGHTLVDKKPDGYDLIVHYTAWRGGATPREQHQVEMRLTYEPLSAQVFVDGELAPQSPEDYDELASQLKRQILDNGHWAAP